MTLEPGQLWYHDSDGSIIMVEAVSFKGRAANCRYRVYHVKGIKGPFYMTVTSVTKWFESGWELLSDV